MPQAAALRLVVLGSRLFPDWLVDRHVGLAVTTYQSGKLRLVGGASRRSLAVSERSLERRLGRCAFPDGRTLWMPAAAPVDRLSKRATEDRCHLNGPAMEDGRSRFVTAFSRADVFEAGGTGDVVHWLRIVGGLMEELYDAVVLPGAARPQACGFKTDAIQRRLSLENDGSATHRCAGERT